MIFFFLLVVWLYSKEELRRRRGERKKIILYIHQNFNDDISNTVGKISTKRVKQHKKNHTWWAEWATQTVQRCWGSLVLWAARVTHSNYCWWHFIILLDLSHQNLFNGTGSIIIKVSIRYASDVFFFLSFVFSLYPLYPLSNLLIKSCVDTYNQ